MAFVTFRAVSSWSGESTYVENEARGFRVALDEPQELGGTNRAMNPVEMLLCALGGCLCICAAVFSHQYGVDLLGARADLEGDLDTDGFFGINPDTRKGYQEIRYRLLLDTPSPADAVERLVAAIKERCPVSDTLAGVRVVADIVTEPG